MNSIPVPAPGPETRAEAGTRVAIEMSGSVVTEESVQLARLVRDGRITAAQGRDVVSARYGTGERRHDALSRLADVFASLDSDDLVYIKQIAGQDQ